MNNPPSIIHAETVAAKLAALKNLVAPAFAAALAKEPRLVELLWFLQWASMQPGGLDKFTQDLLALFPDRLGVPAMLKIGKTDEPYTAAERSRVIEGFPGSWLSAEQYLSNYKLSKTDEQCASILDHFNIEMRGGAKHYNPLYQTEARPNLAFVNKQNHPYFLDCCRRLALLDIPAKICQWLAAPAACLQAPFYFSDLQAALIDMLDAHAARHNQNVAMTEVARAIFDALEFAVAEKAMVEITGDSRFGKTESVKNWCNANPGKARLVKTPCDSCERSFFDAIADAAGCNFAYESPLREVKAKVSFVLKYSGLMFVFDEAAWLLPTRFTSRTTPVRLNYVRSLALDNGCPVALVVTPQFFDSAANKFERTTGFNMAQFKGRIMRKVTLPNELPQQDLLAVVKIHFPDLRESLARRIVAAALLSDSYLFAVEKIAKNARAVARKNGHTAIELEDLEAGIALAGIDAPALTQPARTSMAAPRQTRTAATPIRSTRPAVALEAPARQKQPSIPETQPA